MRPNKLRELLKSDKPTLSTHIHTTWPSVVEAIGHTGLYDYVEFVGEYGPFDLHDLDNLARAADIYNMSMQLKVDQEPRGFLAQRAIGSGFHSILFADCRSAADVQECVRIVRAETEEPTAWPPVVSPTWVMAAPRSTSRPCATSSWPS
jgi:2-keto-3-deoxy-L-rhamnonate aldolase RhmA